MTKTSKIAAALVNFSKAYRAYAEMIRVAGDINVAVQYAAADMFNQIKALNEATAVATIEDETLYLQEVVSRKAAA